MKVLKDGDMESDKITLTKCVKVTRPDSHGEKFGCWYDLAHFSAEAEFDGAETGERIVLELCELTQAEIDAMPEFPGW